MDRRIVEATVTKTDINPKNTIRSLLERWYRSNTEKRLGEKTVRLAGVVGVNPASVTVKNYKSRWGVLFYERRHLIQLENHTRPT